MTTQNIPISIRVKKSRSKMFKEFLKSLDYVEIDEKDNYGFSPDRFVPGDFSDEGASLKALKGIRKGETTDTKQLRNEAWARGKRS